MSQCILCQKEQNLKVEYRIVKVLGYREVEIQKKSKEDLYGRQRKSIETQKQALLEIPGETYEGWVCDKCLNKPRGKKLLGLFLSLGLALVLFLGGMVIQGLPQLLIRMGVFLSLIMVVIFIMPLFRNKEQQRIDLFFLKAREGRQEPIISLQEINYYYGRELTHSLMLREDHWKDLKEEEGIRILPIS